MSLNADQDIPQKEKFGSSEDGTNTKELEAYRSGGINLKRAMENRHIQLIAIGGVIGTGLFLRTAQTLATGGPGGLLIGYTAFATVCISVMLSLGELITLLPVPGGHITLAGRFVDPALSFALGWNYWYFGGITLPGEIAAGAVVINFWNTTINSAVWVTISLVIVIFINFMGPRIYGECEFWFASIKIVTIIGLLILGLVIDLGGAPDHDRRGFRYWHDPGPFTQFLGIDGAKGRFLAFWSSLIQAGYSFVGTEIVSLASAETRNPVKNLPAAIRGVWIRIVIFYVLGAFIIGIIVPSNNPDLVSNTGTAASSAFVVAIRIAGIKALPSIINACILTSAWSAASSDLYISSRALHSLATNGHAPRVFARTNKYGTPYMAVGVTSLLGLLAYMAVSAGASTVFGWFANLTTMCGVINWVVICITAIRFRKGLAAQGLSVESLPYRTRFQPYAAYYGLFWSVVIMLFANWQVFLKGQWNKASFVTNYFGLPFFFVLYLGFKFIYKTRIVRAHEMDFFTFASQALKL
ncbi:hypothetical protein M422DRAFT_35224 [Sphaerobolus stellatus SS14]|uniref:Amino acid permease/ SLC12A domain-containing protein n=1 Tax=Sphaerobolus stellatus (strain SS14) TaxID=990650 RepID=A0A0C9TUZ5_SPHS4|nr:hypothetical protein M422DRAFT_35224 [Sphaerobolus stellatus SS14]